ncbi:MAG: hypothetical protein D6706_11935 [Chloroflexi bacterium]|nr:MAG: hypothetical protein D6706_11935 [Chloroflexota bacterium]
MMKTKIEEHPNHKKEKGQSLVLIALAITGLLAMVGLAVDIGFVFARSSQLQAAVDAAALAAVTELTGGSIADADLKAGQFLNTNDIPDFVVQTMQSSTNNTILSSTEYSLTVTWPVELYFLKLVGMDTFTITKSATAAYFPLADIYASRRVDQGTVSTSNQGIFGPDICTSYGDPFSPLNSPWAPEIYTYQYRILIPPDYPDDILRVELFDPDSINQSANTHNIVHTKAAVDRGLSAVPESKSCTGGSSNRKNPCLIDTGELALINQDPTIDIDQINPYWFVRIDENRGSGTPGVCGSPKNYDPTRNTQTNFLLYYFRENPDGTVTRVNLASYTGQTGDGARDNGDHDTDMRWVTPGGKLSFDQSTPVPVDAGSQKTFELNINTDLPNILVDPATGNRYVYLDVTSISGASENGFEIWAGPDDYINTVPSDVNDRNIYVINNPGSHSSRGVTVFGLGRLPMNSNFDSPIEIPLLYVGPEMAGQSIFVRLFDTDSGAQPPITFFFDTISEDDWSLTFGIKGQTDPDGVPADSRCLPGSCNNQWVDPPYEIKVPGILDNCDYQNPTMEDCTPFYGGRLVVRYEGGFSDTYGWEITVTGLPYLIR